MSKYTVTIAELCKELAYTDTNNPTILISQACPQIFDFPISLNIKHKWELLNKLLRHYYFNEICCETFGMWQLMLQSKCEEIENKYRSLYAANALDINKFANYNRKENIEITGKSDKQGERLEYTRGQSTNIASSASTNAYSDTPEGSLTGVKELEYLSSATSDTSETSDTTTSDTNNNIQENNRETKTENHINIIEGIDGVIGYELLYNYTEKVLEIDRMFIAEFSDLFMTIF